MTRSIEELAAGCHRSTSGLQGEALGDWFDYEQFADLVRQECQAELQQEWYRLNDIEPVTNETARDVGFRVGAKSGLITGINLLRNMWTAECK